MCNRIFILHSHSKNNAIKSIKQISCNLIYCSVGVVTLISLLASYLGAIWSFMPGLGPLGATAQATQMQCMHVWRGQ